MIQGAVPIGTAAQFGVLSGSGITNSGVTTVRGDVGSTPTVAETGFEHCPAANCVVLVGTNHNTVPTPNDTKTQTAKHDLTAAYNFLAGLQSSVIPTELGNQHLTAGVYRSASGTFGMTGTLILDGQHQTGGGVFVFQTASTLITGSSGRVVLINGADACNVFYQVGSAATLGSGSTLQGTILAHDSVSLGNRVTVNGRLLAGEQASGAGAVTLIHDTITSSLCAHGVSTPSGTTHTGSGSTGSTPTGTGSTPTGKGTPSKPSSTPTGSTGGQQVTQVPVGGVHAGDGSMSATRKSPGKPDAFGTAAFVLAAAGGLLLAGAGARTVVTRRRPNS